MQFNDHNAMPHDLDSAVSVCLTIAKHTEFLSNHEPRPRLPRASVCQHGFAIM